MNTILNYNFLLILCIFIFSLFSCDKKKNESENKDKNEKATNNKSNKGKYTIELIKWKARANYRPGYTVPTPLEIDKTRAYLSDDELKISHEFFKSYHEIFYHYKIKDENGNYIKIDPDEPVSGSSSTNQESPNSSSTEGMKMVEEIKSLKIEAVLKDNNGPIKGVSNYSNKSHKKGEFYIVLVTNDSLPPNSSIPAEIEITITNKDTSTTTKKTIKVHTTASNPNR